VRKEKVKGETRDEQPFRSELDSSPSIHGSNAAVSSLELDTSKKRKPKDASAVFGFLR
jgi:hypothetical protein